LRIEKLRREFGLEVRWIAFPLHTEIPDEGVTLDQLFPGGRYDFKGSSERQKDFALKEGLPWSAGEGMVYNSTRSQVLSKWAESEGRGEIFHEAAFRATFVDRLNIAEASVLRKMAETAGLNPENTEKALKDKAYTAAVNADWDLCRRRGVTAVPTLSMEGRSISGAQPYETMQKLVKGKGPQHINGLKMI